MQKILITGANGFIGSNLVKYFYQNGFNIYGVVRKQSNLKFLKDLKINLIFCDLKEIDESLFGDD
ncbi:MAG: NAD-dependent epimerase/dehydratase family protein, partial [Spirochaetes bacterium]|nr:NAD-dependent epimerase/dehydratase family protein [Spirochaetota bacterium]